MPLINSVPDSAFLSELYAADDADAVLLAEYPSSNSNETRFQNRDRYIIHDPDPPPRRELLKILGPHHLMCGWGNALPVCSEIGPPEILLQHWREIFGDAGCPQWQAFSNTDRYVTLFPHESLTPEQQTVDPTVNYFLHSKEVIAEIDCAQAAILDCVEPPCIVKLSHGYAGLGNFIVRNEVESAEMVLQLEEHWPDAKKVINSIIPDIVNDFGVQFYLRKDGTIIWIGFTKQMFDESKRWSGGQFSADQQTQFREQLSTMIIPAAEYLSSRGYFGLVGIDILIDASGGQFLVDVNPRLTGITPFLFASRRFVSEGLTEGIYSASRTFNGSTEQLFEKVHSIQDAKVLVLSTFEQNAGASTKCHLSVSSASQKINQRTLNEIFHA